MSQRHVQRIAHFAKNATATAHDAAVHLLALRARGLQVQILHAALAEQQRRRSVVGAEPINLVGGSGRRGPEAKA